MTQVFVFLSHYGLVSMIANHCLRVLVYFIFYLNTVVTFLCHSRFKALTWSDVVATAPTHLLLQLTNYLAVLSVLDRVSSSS